MKIYVTLFSCVSLIFTAVLSFAGDSVHFNTNTRVSVSTVTASPTTLFTADKDVKDVALINSTTNYILLGDADTSFSTSASTGTFRLPGTPSGATPVPFWLRAYRGTLKAVSGGAGAVSIDVLATE